MLLTVYPAQSFPHSKLTPTGPRGLRTGKGVCHQHPFSIQNQHQVLNKRNTSESKAESYFPALNFMKLSNFLGLIYAKIWFSKSVHPPKNSISDLSVVFTTSPL